MTCFTLRIPKELLLKLGYIADYYGRTKNKELEQMIRSRIKSFESKHEVISIQEKDWEVNPSFLIDFMGLLLYTVILNTDPVCLGD